jgi:hypothetical protein
MGRIGAYSERETGLECPVCTFLNGDGSVILGWSSAGLALDSSWQSADLDLFSALTDQPMITLLGSNMEHDLSWLHLLEHRSIAGPLQDAVRSRLAVDGYMAGRILLRTARKRLSWPCGDESDRWRETILAHRRHERGSHFRSTGAWLHVHRVAAQAGLVNDALFVAAALAVFRTAFADAVAEGLLAQDELTQHGLDGPDGWFH